MSDHKPKKVGDPGFGRVEQNDGRAPGEWRTRYPRPVYKLVRLEALYLLFLFILALIVPFLLWAVKGPSYLQLAPRIHRTVLEIAMPFFGGLLGGTMFSIKWLYHSYAKWTWNRDRVFWRFMTPILSGGLALVLLLLARSKAVTILDAGATHRLSAGYSLGFLIGYFSDNAIGKLSEIASTLFGSPTKTSESSSSVSRRKHGDESAPVSARDDQSPTNRESE